MRNISKEITSLIAGFLVFFAVVFSARTQETQTITADDIHDCMIYEDYVVEGVVVSIKIERIPLKDFFDNVTNPFFLKMKQMFMIIELELEKALIGCLNKDRITLYGLNASDNWLYDIEEGEKYIFSLLRKYYEGEIYSRDGEDVREYKGYIYGIKTSDKCRFLIKGDTFLRGRKSDPIQTGRVSDLYKAIDEIKRKRSIETVTDEAELIVRGNLREKWTTKDTLSNGLNKNIVRIRLKVDECLKGNIEEGEVEFSVIYMASYNPFWKAEVPHVNTGEEWLVFLKWAEEPGYYPFAGVNGMFKVEENKLIRDNRIIMEKSLNEMKAVISKEEWEGDNDAE